MKYFAEMMLLILIGSIILFLYLAVQIVLYFITDGSAMAIVGAYMLGFASPCMIYYHFVSVGSGSGCNTSMSTTLDSIRRMMP